MKDPRVVAVVKWELMVEKMSEDDTDSQRHLHLKGWPVVMEETIHASEERLRVLTGKIPVPDDLTHLPNLTRSATYCLQQCETDESLGSDLTVLSLYEARKEVVTALLMLLKTLPEKVLQSLSDQWSWPMGGLSRLPSLMLVNPAEKEMLLYFRRKNRGGA